MGRSVMDGVGEGTWAVFAEKVSAERDEAREKLEEAKKEIERLKGSIGEQSRLILEAEERGARWALEHLGVKKNAARSALDICVSARTKRLLGILAAWARRQASRS